MPQPAELPDDPEHLKRLVIEGRAALVTAHHEMEAARHELKAAHSQIQNRDVLIEH